MEYQFEMKVSAFNTGPGAEANSKVGIIAPAPSNVEALRQIAESVTGDYAFILAGILRKAADELDTANSRLQYLIDNDAYVIDRRGYRVIQACWGDDEELTPYNKATGGCGWESAEAAIDAARMAK